VGRDHAATKRQELDARLAGLTAKLAAIDDPAREEVRRARSVTSSPPGQPPQPIARWDFDNDCQDQNGERPGTPQREAWLQEGRLVLDGSTAYVVTAPLKKPLEAKTLEAWVSLAHLKQRGGGVMTVQTLDGVVFDSIVFGEREPEKWVPGSNNFVR